MIQDLLPYNETIADVRNVYKAIGEDQHYVNCVAIKSENQTITVGKTYVLIQADANRAVNAYNVRLLDVFYYNENIYLLLLDTESQKVMLVTQFMDAIDLFCGWKLLDWEYLKKKAEES